MRKPLLESFLKKHGGNVDISGQGNPEKRSNLLDLFCDIVRVAHNVYKKSPWVEEFKKQVGEEQMKQKDGKQVVFRRGEHKKQHEL